MKRRHFILRELSDTAFITDGMIRPKSLGLEAIPSVGIEIDELDERQADLARKDGNAVVGVAMLTNLVKPMATNENSSPQSPWGIGAIGADASVFTGAGSSVAIFDTGIDRSHPAFASMGPDQIVEKDFTGTNNGDGSGHGTHCAATVFGQSVDGLRIGVAPGIKQAYIGKVLDDYGGGTSEMIFDALLWAVDEGVDVVSMSLGFDFPGQVQKAVQQYGYAPEQAASQTLVDFVENLRAFEAIMQLVQAKRPREEGSIVVAATGNDSKEEYRISAALPGASRGVISVGAIDKPIAGSESLNTIATFSNSLPSVVAPGVDILSAQSGGGLVEKNGTSMACPHVAGVAALWWEKVRKMPVPTTADVVQERLLAACRENVFAENVRIVDRGRGMITAP